MKERPILMAAPMVRATLEDIKLQTRRAVTPQPKIEHWQSPFMMSPKGGKARCRPVAPDWPDGEEDDFYCPYGQPGDRLWVRETFDPIYPQDPSYNGGKPIEYDYQATYKHGDRLGDLIGVMKKWKPSIHMPRAASRITLEITGVRVERLQDISRGDAMAEGCPFPNMAHGNDPRKWYADLLEQINGPGSWDANPWVWVVEFRRIK